MKTSLFLLFFLISYGVLGQGLTLPELRKLKITPVYDNIQVPDAQIVFPITGMTSMKVKQEYNPMSGSTQYLEVELYIVDATGRLVYAYVTTTKGDAKTIIDEDYVRYMGMQGFNMLRRTGNKDRAVLNN